MALKPSQWGRGRQTDARIGIGGGRVDFALDLRRWAEKIKDQLDESVRKISLEAFSRVILRSPVDTGRFRGNWQVTTGNIAMGSLIVEDKTGQITIARAEAELLGVRAGDIVHLTNNLVYGRRLEYGWSKQAPIGMVGITAAEFQAIVDGVVQEVAR